MSFRVFESVAGGVKAVCKTLLFWYAPDPTNPSDPFGLKPLEQPVKKFIRPTFFTPKSSPKITSFQMQTSLQHKKQP
jgi:hypothetical protein